MINFSDLFGVSQDKWAEVAYNYIAGEGDLNRHHPISSWTLLHIAVEFEEHEVIRLAVSQGANINAQDVDGWTSLHHAVDSDIDNCLQSYKPVTMPTVRLLLELGADEAIRNNRGETARDIAAHYSEQGLYDALSKGLKGT